MALNKAMLIGNVGQDPEIRNVQGGAKVATFSLATTERWKDRNGDTKEVTEWHRITAWDKRADFVEAYVRKGNQVFVEGKITTRQWTDQDGKKNYTTEIQASNIQILVRREDISEKPSTGREQSLNPEDNPQDLPF